MMHQHASFLRPSLLAAALLVATSACSSKAPSAPQANTPAPAVEITQAVKDQTKQQFRELSEMQLIDDRCQWLDATSRVALDATAAERQAWLADHAADALADASLLDTAKTQADAVDCAVNNAVNSKYVALRYGVWQMRVTWALRGYALLDGGERPAWYTQQSPVLAERAALTETHAALVEKFGASINEHLPTIETEAQQMLAAACPNTPKNCNTATPSAESAAYAKVWLDFTTKFAKALANDPVKLPPVPQADSDDAEQGESNAS